MKKAIFRNRFWAVMGLCLVFALSYSNAFARDSRDSRDRSRGHERGHEVVIVGHERYNYHDGRFFRPGWFGIEFAVFAPPIGAIVTSLPGGYGTIIVGGIPHYYYNHVYYRPCPSGYIVVPESEITQPQGASGATITINVPNSNGSYTPITLVRRNNGYVGPQGEYYAGNPTVEQLKALYGR